MPWPDVSADYTVDRGVYPPYDTAVTLTGGDPRRVIDVGPGGMPVLQDGEDEVTNPLVPVGIGLLCGAIANAGLTALMFHLYGGRRGGSLWGPALVSGIGTLVIGGGFIALGSWAQSTQDPFRRAALAAVVIGGALR